MHIYSNLRDKFLTKIQLSNVIIALLVIVLSGCVTQNFENGETPVVINQANRDDMAATRISLGLGYLKMGNMPQAKQNLEKAKKFAPEMVQVYTAFAHYYETVAEPDLTVKAYEKALSLKDDDANTLNNYGVYLCRQGQVEAAEKQLLKAIAVPSYILVAKSYENLSSCFLKKDNFVKAEVYLSKAIAHNPSSASTLFEMVRLQYAMGEYKQAKQFEQRFEKVTRRFTPQSLALAYKVYTKLEQNRTAKNYASMLVKMYPQSWEAQQYLLNELELIEPDNLAKRYQLTKVNTKVKKSKKRVIKLSPKKALPVVAEVNIKSQSKQPTVVLESVPAKVMPPASTVASVSVISAALTTTPVVESKTDTEAAVQAEKTAVLKEEAPLDDIETSHVAKKALPITAVVEPKTDTGAAVQAQNISIAKEDAPLSDTEIFHVAKKPLAIVEDAEEKAVELKVVGKKDLKQIKKEAKLTVKEQPPNNKTKNFPDFHIIESGDTLYNISVKYNIKIKALRKWNKISKNKKLHIKDIIFLENPKTVNK